MSDRSDVRFRVHFQSCGPLRVGPAQVALRFGADSSPSYRFQCPDCGLLHIEPVRPQAVAALIEAEVGCFHDALADDAALSRRPPTRAATDQRGVVDGRVVARAARLLSSRRVVFVTTKEPDRVERERRGFVDR